MSVAPRGFSRGCAGVSALLGQFAAPQFQSLFPCVDPDGSRPYSQTGLLHDSLGTLPSLSVSHEVGHCTCRASLLACSAVKVDFSSGFTFFFYPVTDLPEKGQQPSSFTLALDIFCEDLMSMTALTHPWASKHLLEQLQLPRAQISKSVLDWLLDEQEPSVRHYTLVELAGRNAKDPLVEENRQQIGKRGWAARILEKQTDRTYWENAKSCYVPKWASCAWQLVVLADLGVSGEDPRVKNCIEHSSREASFTLKACDALVTLSPATIRRTTSIASSRLTIGRFHGYPSGPFRNVLPPAPISRIRRPPESLSRVAAAIAIKPGWREYAFITPAPIFTRFVAAAMNPARENVSSMK